MPEADVQKEANGDLDKKANAAGAIATLASGSASYFITDYRLLGLAFTAATLLLSGIAVYLRAKEVGPKRMKKVLSGVSIGIALVPIVLLAWTYMHPVSKPPVAQAPPPPVAAPAPSNETDSHDSYKISTSGKNSPVITGGTAPINIGDHYEQTPKKEKKAK